MKKKLLALLARYKGLILYTLFGVGTTGIDFAVLFCCHTLLGMPAWISNVCAWICSVIFAFVTNKPFIFHSMDWSPKVVFPEFIKFAGCRLSTLGLETGFIYLTVDLLHCSALMMKVLISGVVIAVNYVGAKLLVFKSPKDETE